MPLIGYRFENVLQAEPKMAYKRQSFIPIDYESTTLRILDVGYFIVSSFHAFHFHVPECRQEILSICLKNAAISHRSAGDCKLFCNSPCRLAGEYHQ